MNGASRDPAEAVRQQARTALASLPLTAASLAPLLADFDGIEVGLAATPAAGVKTRKRAKSGAAEFAAVEQLDILQLAGKLLHQTHNCNYRQLQKAGNLALGRVSAVNFNHSTCCLRTASQHPAQLGTECMHKGKHLLCSHSSKDEASSKVLCRHLPFQL